MINPYIVGKHIYLRPPVEKDAEGPWHEWFSDEDVTRYLEARIFPNTVEEQIAFLRSVTGTPSEVVLAIIDKQNDRHIGVAALRGINWVHSFGDIAVVLGDKSYWQKAVYGLEAHTLLLRAAFLRLNLENIRASYMERNERARDLLALLRFREAGRYHNLYSIGGERCDGVLMQLSRKEWLARNPNAQADETPNTR